MAIIDLESHFRGKQVLGKADEFFGIMRDFVQKSDDPAESLVAILYAMGKLVASSPDPKEVNMALRDAIRDVMGTRLRPAPKKDPL